MTTNVSIHSEELIHLLSSPIQSCIFIKNEYSKYLYANHNFLQLMGLQSLKQLRQLSDLDLSKNKAEAKKYQEHHNRVLEETKALEVCELISPDYNQPIEKMMQGTLYPLLSDKGQVHAVLGVVRPVSKLLNLDFDTIFSITQKQLKELLIQRSYLIHLSLGSIKLSKMEICTLIQLVKGAHAGEIAQSLEIKQTTAESYLASIKNKFGVTSKSDLIHLITSEKILQQIIL